MKKIRYIATLFAVLCASLAHASDAVCSEIIYGTQIGLSEVKSVMMNAGVWSVIDAADWLEAEGFQEDLCFGIAYFPKGSSPACYLTLETYFMVDDIIDFNPEDDHKDRTMLVRYNLSDGNFFVAPVHGNFKTQLPGDNAFSHLAVSLGDATYSSEVEEVGHGWNAWSTLKFINSRLGKHDIVRIDFAFLYPDGSIEEITEIGVASSGSAGYFQAMFEDISDYTNDTDFYNYSWD